MHSPGSSGLLRILVVCCLGLHGALAIGASAPSFTIAATNVTMPSEGNLASSKFTLTSVNSYAGQIRVSCAYSGSEMGARVPSCGIYTNPTFNLRADQTVTGTLTLFPYGKVVNFSSASRPGEPAPHEPMLALAIVSVFLLGLRLRNKGSKWHSLVVLACAAVVLGITSCGSGLSGTFPYAVTAVDTRTNTTENTSIMVTVP
jgi:hypothetical protein